MEEVTMEEESIPWLKQDWLVVVLLQKRCEAFKIGTCLPPCKAMRNTSHMVATREYPQAAVFNRMFIESYHDGHHFWEQASVAVPVPIVLVPLPSTSNTGLLDHDLSVVVVSFFLDLLQAKFGL